MYISLADERVQLTRDWAALKLQTIEKANLKEDEIHTLIEGRMNANLQSFTRATPLTLGRYKEKVIKIFEQAAGKVFSPPAICRANPTEIERSKLENLSLMQLQGLVAKELLSLSEVISGRKQFLQKTSRFQWGLFRDPLDPSLHPDLGPEKGAIILSRIKKLPVGYLNYRDPRIEEKETIELIEKANVKSESGRQAVTRLWAIGMIKKVPLNDIILISRNLPHCSSPVAEGGEISMSIRHCIEMSRPDDKFVSRQELYARAVVQSL